MFWGIVHTLEASTSYEPLLVESLRRKPTQFGLLMVNRLLNGGIRDVDGIDLLRLLEEIASSSTQPAAVIEKAKNFLGHQREKHKA